MIPVAYAQNVTCPTCKFPSPGCELYEHNRKAGWYRVICRCKEKTFLESPATEKTAKTSQLELF